MNRFIFTLRKNARHIVCITGFFLFVSMVLYGYYGFFTPEKLNFIYRNWDGPGYLVVAKTFYNADAINRINPFSFLLASHYAFQFPLYPLFIRLFSFIGWNESMIFVSQFFALSFSIALYFLVKIINPNANALVIALLSVFYTPRWFIVSHVGSSEPLFLLLVTIFMLCVYKKKFFLSAFCLALAQLAKPQGIVFFIGIAIYYGFMICFTRKKSIRRNLREFIPYFMIPLALMSICTLYYFSFGNFSLILGDDVLHTMNWSLLQVLVTKEILNFPVGFFSVWKEAIVYNYIIYFIPIAILFEKKFLLFGVVALVYFISVLSIIQTDIARYIMPLLPFLFLGFSDVLSKKPVYIALFLCFPMVFLYAIGFINYNIAILP